MELGTWQSEKLPELKRLCLLFTMKKLFALIFLLGMAWTKQPNYLPCGGTGKIDHVNVIPCDDPSECLFTRGDKATINILFTPSQNHEGVNAQVFGDVFGVHVPFPIGECQDTCKCGVECPVVANKQYNFTTTLDVKKMYPPIAVAVTLHLQDAKSKADISCMQFSVKLQ